MVRIIHFPINVYGNKWAMSVLFSHFFADIFATKWAGGFPYADLQGHGDGNYIVISQK